MITVLIYDIIAPLDKLIMLHCHNDLNNYHHHDDLYNYQYHNNLYMWDMYGLNAELGFLDTWWSQDNKINSKRFSTLFLFKLRFSRFNRGTSPFFCNFLQVHNNGSWRIPSGYSFMVNQDARAVD